MKANLHPKMSLARNSLSVLLAAGLLLATPVAGADPADSPASSSPGELKLTTQPRLQQLKADLNSDPTRVIFSTSAFSRPRGTLNWTMYELGLHQLDYQATDNLNIGINALVPVAVVGLMAHAQYNWSISKYFHVGVRAQAAFFTEFVEGEMMALAYGGGPVMTIGTPDLFLNVHVPMYGLSAAADDDFETRFALFPSIGGSWRVARRLRINVEVHKPLSPDFDSDANTSIWAVLYGVRIFGENIYGDISFVLPLSEDAGEYLKYMPMGLPLLTLGYSW